MSTSFFFETPLHQDQRNTVVLDKRYVNLLPMFILHSNEQNKGVLVNGYYLSTQHIRKIEFDRTTTIFLRDRFQCSMFSY